jgi:hypothetical protein
MDLSAEHDHLVDLRTRRLICCCESCGLLFSGRQSALYRRVPRTVQSLPDFRLSDSRWESLLIPISLAFFYRAEDGKARKDNARNENVETAASVVSAGQPSEPLEGRIIAVYPSPAGPVESLLELDSWQAIAEDNPQLHDLQPEVEALLVNRLSGKHLYYFLPIDQCYRLSGLIRLHWRGLSGGSAVWEEVDRFFQRLKEESCSI